MSALAQAAVSSALDVEAALPNVRIRIQGLPEDVQWIADALETALPGVMDWHSFAQVNAASMIELSGIGHKYSGTSGIKLS